VSANRDVALRLATAGVAIFPCRNCPADKINHKTPMVKWRSLSTTSKNRIEQWWEQWPDALPGIDLGKAELIVLDGDRHPDDDGIVRRDGVAALERVFARHGIDPKSIPTVVTPGKGGHCYFRQPEGKPLGNKEGSLKGLGINIRGCGGFTIAPGATWLDGRRYGWDHRTPNFYTALRLGTIPVLPNALAELLRPARAPKAIPEPAARLRAAYHPSPGKITDPERYARVALGRESDEVAATPNGNRNNALNRAAFNLGTLAGAGLISTSEIGQALMNAAARNGYIEEHGDIAAINTIRSGLSAGIKNPRIFK
jgi:hypothetical protein